MADENKYNIKIEAGTDFVLPFIYRDENGNPYDLTGTTIEAQLREASDSPDAFDFICTHNDEGGQITLTMPHEVTAEIPFSTGHYDVHVTWPETGDITLARYGDVKIQDDVTKPLEGTMLYMIGIDTYEDLPEQGLINRLYFCYEDRKIYRWNGTNYIATSVGNGIQRIDYLDGGTYRMVFDDGTYFDFESVPRIMGTYDATVAYEKLDIVHGTDGATYIAKLPVPAGTALSNATYWQQMTPKALTIGTVSTVSADTGASASIGGTPDAPVLNLSIPRGVTGNESINDGKWIGDTDYVLSADRNYTITEGIMLAKRIEEYGEVTLTEDDFEQGSVSGSFKTAHDKRLRTKYLIPVKKGTKVFLDNNVLESSVWVKEKTNSETSAYNSIFVPASESHLYIVPIDGYIVILLRKNPEAVITMEDFDTSVTIIAPDSDAMHCFEKFDNFLYEHYMDGSTSKIRKVATNYAASTKLTFLPDGIYEGEVKDGYYLKLANGFTSGNGNVTQPLSGKGTVCEFQPNNNAKYAYVITKADGSEITPEEAKEAFTFRKNPLQEPPCVDYNGAKVADIKVYDGTCVSTTNYYGTTIYSLNFYISHYYKMPKDGLIVTLNGYTNIGTYLQFAKLQDGKLVEETDYEYSGKNIPASKGPFLATNTIYYPFKEDMYFRIVLKDDGNDFEKCNEALYVGFGKPEMKPEGKLPNLSLGEVTTGTIPGSDDLTGLYPYMGGNGQIYLVSVIRLCDAKSVSCPVDYCMMAFFYDDDNHYLGCSGVTPVIPSIFRGLNYIDFSKYGKTGYAFLVIRKSCTRQIPQPDATEISLNYTYTGILRGYAEFYENVSVEYYPNVSVQHINGMNPVIAHNIHALKSMIFPKIFAFKYANGHDGTRRYDWPEEPDVTPTVYGGTTYYGGFLANVTVKSYATALQNFNSDFYKTDWELDRAVWDNYGFVCNANVSCMHGYMWETGTTQFYLSNSENILGMQVIHNFDPRYDYEKIKPGDWLIGRDFSNNDGHFMLVTDIVYINGEIISIEVLESSAIERYTTFFVGAPLSNIRTLMPETGIQYRVVAHPDYSKLRRLEDVYGNLTTDYTVGTLMCNRGTDSVYGYSNKHCYITVNDDEMVSFDVYKDDVLVETVTLPASDSDDWVTFGNHPLKAVDIIGILRREGTGYYTLIPDNKEEVQESFFVAPNYNMSFSRNFDAGTYTIEANFEHTDEIAYIFAVYDGVGTTQPENVKITHLPEEFGSGNHLVVPFQIEYDNQQYSFNRFLVIYKTERYGTFFVYKSYDSITHSNQPNRYIASEQYEMTALADE